MARSINAVIGTVAFALLASGAVAQPDPPANAPQRGALASPHQPGSRPPGSVYFLEGPSLTVDFQGGTLSEFVDALRSAAPAPVNVAVAREAAELKVPPVSLAAVSVHSALQVASQVVERPERSELRVDRISGAFEADGTPASAAAFAISLQQFAGASKPPPATDLRVFSLREIVREGGMPAESALTGVEAALSLSDGGSKEPQVKFHEDTAMLIVRGTPEQLRVVNDVVSQLVAAAVDAREREARLEMAELELDFEQKKAETRLELARIRVEGAKQEVAEAEILHESARMPESELRAARERLAMARAEESLADEEVRVMQQRKRLLRQLGDAPATARPARPEVRSKPGPDAPIGEIRDHVRESQRERSERPEGEGERE